MKDIRYNIQVWREESIKFFTKFEYKAWTPDYDVSAIGKNPMDAVENLKIEVRRYLEYRIEQGLEYDPYKDYNVVFINHNCLISTEE